LGFESWVHSNKIQGQNYEIALGHSGKVKELKWNGSSVRKALYDIEVGVGHLDNCPDTISVFKVEITISS
jgi:hypothetical protein